MLEESAPEPKARLGEGFAETWAGADWKTAAEEPSGRLSREEGAEAV